jgi:hypothetical protein
VSTCHITAATGSELKKLKKGMQMNNNKVRCPVTDEGDVHANNGAAQQKIELLFSRYSALAIHTDPSPPARFPSWDDHAVPTKPK